MTDTKTFRLSAMAEAVAGSMGHLLRREASRHLAGALTALACVPTMVLAGPEGEVVVSGAVTVNRPDGKTTQVQQASEQSILNWRSFSIAGDEYVQFVQPGSGSVSLNRVVGGSPSEILGRLSANGQVFLVNPRGIYFGPGARVDVSGLVASVLDIRDEDFQSGRYVFAQATDTAGARVVNAGTITAADGGYVVLAGEGAVNEGLIEARLGTVVLASGAQMTLDVSGTGLVDFAVDAAAVGEAAGVANVGAIVADGGRVLMSAKVAEGLVATAVNNEGLIRAHGIEERNGQVYLRAAGGDIEQSGTIDVSGEGGQAGGTVEVTTDQDIALSAGSRILADGDGAAAGGSVEIIADGRLEFRKDSEISARGAGGAKGGFVELSGHEAVSIRGELLLGRGGELLIDPATITIVGSNSSAMSISGNIGEHFIEDQLNNGVSLTLSASSSINAYGGPFTINASTGSAPVRLTMQISGSTGNINLTGIDIHIREGELVIAAGTTSGDITVGNVQIDGGEGHGVAMTAAGGNITVGNINVGTIGNGILSGGGDWGVMLNAGGNVNAGTLAVGNIFVSDSSATVGNVGVHVMAGGSNLTVGTVTVGDLGTSGISGSLRGANVGNLGVHLGASSGAVTVNGDITVGNIRAIASSIDGSLGGMGDVGVDIDAGNGIHVAGNIHVGTLSIAGSTAGDVGVVLDNSGNSVSAGAITVDAIRAAGIGSSMSMAGVAIYNSSGSDIDVGDIRVGGSTAGGLFAPNASSRGVVLNAGSHAGAGNIEVFRSSGNVRIDVDGNSGVTVSNLKLEHSFDSDATIQVTAAGGTIQVNGSVHVIGVGTIGAFPVDMALASLNNAAGGVHVTGDVTAEQWGIGDAKVRINGTTIGVGGMIKASVSTAAGDGWVDLDATNGGVSLGDVFAIGSTGSINITANNGDVTQAPGKEMDAHAGGKININVTNGDIKVGNLTAYATSTSGEIHLTATGNIETGNLHAAGNTAGFESGDGWVDIDAGGHVTTGAITVSGSSADVSISAGGNIVVQGNITATASNSSASIDIRTTAGGAITVNGDLLAEGTSADVNVTVNGGPGGITVNGNITARGTSDSGSIDLITNGGGAITVNGDLLAEGQGPNDINIFVNNGPGDVHLNGAITMRFTGSSANTAQNEIDIGAEDGTIFVNGAITVTGASSNQVDFYLNNGASTGSGNVVGSGLITADHIRFLGDSGDFGSIDVRTNSQHIQVGGGSSSYGGGFLFTEVAIDNTAYTGIGTNEAVVDFNGGDSFGRVKVRFGGDGRVDGSLAANSAVAIEAIGGQLTITNTLGVGSGLLPSDVGGGSDLLLQGLTENAIPFVSETPNLYLGANGPINANGLDLQNAASYLLFKANDHVQLGSVANAPADILVHYQPWSPDATSLVDSTIGVDDLGDVTCTGSCTLNLNTADNFAVFPGTTFVVGSVNQTGSIFVGPTTLVDENLVFVLHGGLGNMNGLSGAQIMQIQLLGAAELGSVITTSGKVIVIDPIFSSDFLAPIPSDDYNQEECAEDSGDECQGEQYGEEGEGDEGEGLITQETGSENMCT